MKKNLLLLWFVFWSAVTGYAQQFSCEGRTLSLGTVTQFLNHFQTQGNGVPVRLAAPGGSIFDVKVNYRQQVPGGPSRFQGEMTGEQGSSFSIEINHKELKGHLILLKAKKAYTYFSDINGNAFIEETDINKLLCVSFPGVKESAQEQGTQAKPTIDPAVADLQSFPGATGCLLLDFDGYEMPAGNLWNNGNPISAAASGMTNEDITITWQIVSEDFIPFNINVTTNEAVYNTYAQNKRMRCVVTPTNYFFPGAGGVAYLNSFSWNNNVPCWVFTAGVGTGGKNVGEVSSHELGHTFGLSHDGTPADEYYAGQGNWAPIMGVGYYESVTQWSKGEYTNANNTEDDLAIIANATNAVGYRADDYSNIPATAPVLNHVGGVVSAAQNKGTIGTTGDIDRFYFTHAGGALNLEIAAIPDDYTNVRLFVVLYNSLNVAVQADSALDTWLSLPVFIYGTLPPGTYYLTVTGTSEGTASGTGYTNYASLGAYGISGTFNAVPLPVAMSKLRGKVIDEDKTLLNWETFSERNNIGFIVERSADGRNFKDARFVPSDAPGGNSSGALAYGCTDTGSLSGTSYYRLLQVDADGKRTFSNIVKIAVATQSVALVDTPEMYIQNPAPEERLKEYELISGKYNDLFDDLLPDLNKMGEEYQEARRQSRLATFLSR